MKPLLSRTLLPLLDEAINDLISLKLINVDLDDVGTDVEVCTEKRSIMFEHSNGLTLLIRDCCDGEYTEELDVVDFVDI